MNGRGKKNLFLWWRSEEWRQVVGEGDQWWGRTSWPSRATTIPCHPLVGFLSLSPSPTLSHCGPFPPPSIHSPLTNWLHPPLLSPLCFFPSFHHYIDKTTYLFIKIIFKLLTLHYKSFEEEVLNIYLSYQTSLKGWTITLLLIHYPYQVEIGEAI